MKKNYVFLVVDSLNYSHVKESPINLMPFLNELKKKSISCENMYSQAPYTEAALMNLICGQNVLDNGGYMYRFRDAKATLFEEVQKKGYYVYTNSYEPQCYPTSVRRGLNDQIYMFGYDSCALWSYRISYYADLYKKNEIREDDYCIVKDILEDNFVSWIRWIDEYLSKDISTSMIWDNSRSYNPKSVKDRVEAEFEKYKCDKKQYIIAMFNKGLKHEYFMIQGFKQDNKIKNRDILMETQKMFNPIFKRIRLMGLKHNTLRNQKLFSGPLNKFGEFLKKPDKVKWKNFLKASYLSINSLIDLDLYKRINKDYDVFKDGPSCKRQIDYFMNWAKEYKEDRPFFSYLHVNDVHNPEIFFSYDSEDIDELKAEAEMASHLLDDIPKGYYGNLTHDLSLRYIDGSIKYLFEKLEESNMLSDTVVIICADHGFSFSGNPLRDSFVINLYLENYNIPFLVYGTDKPVISIEQFTSSMDIPATICDLIDGQIPETFAGRSVLKGDYRNALTIEYCGGGCPDILKRDIKMAAFNKDYFVGTLAKISDLLENNITEIYNLKEDPKQMKNLCKLQYDKGQVGELLKLLEERQKEILSYFETK